MGLFDAFTGAPGVAAAGANKDLLAGTQQSIAQRTQATKNTALGYLDQGYGAAGGQLAQGYDAAGNAINTGASGAQNYLTQGAGNAAGALTAGGGAYAPLSALAGQYGKGANLYADAVGVNGAAGNANATSAFQAGPGYQFALDQGLNSINRAANARGMANSGNTDTDALKYGTGLANQTYQQWLGNLAPYNQMQLQATQGAAAGNQGNNQALAGIYSGLGQQQAGVATGQGNSLADLARSYYGGQANLDTSRGTALAGNETGANQLITQADLNIVPQIAGQNTAAAGAQMGGNANLWNFGLQAAKLAAGAAGGASGGGGSFSPAMWNSSLPAGSFTGA
jgi:hypothetical protein